jgi:hypothetical protein
VLLKVERRARGTQLVVEVVQLGVVRLAHVAVRGFAEFAGVGPRGVVASEVVTGEVVRGDEFRRVHVRRGEDGFGAQPPDARLGQDFVVATLTLVALAALAGLQPTAPFGDVGREHVTRRVDEADALLLRHHLEHGRVGDHRLEQLRRGADPRAEVVDALRVHAVQDASRRRRYSEWRAARSSWVRSAWAPPDSTTTSRSSPVQGNGTS